MPEGTTEGTTEGTAATTEAAATTAGTEAAERAFSQADVDRILKDRLARQRAQFEGFDELKEKAARLDEIEEANRSELERAQKAAADAIAEREALSGEVREARLKAALLAELTKPDRKVADVEAAIQLLDRSTLELDDNGLPTNTAQAVDTLLEQRPILVVQAGGATRGSADQGARQHGTEQLSRAALAQMTPDEINKARSEGRLDGVLSGG